jgi:hypothetical protein
MFGKTKYQLIDEGIKNDMYNVMLFSLTKVKKKEIS